MIENNITLIENDIITLTGSILSNKKGYYDKDYGYILYNLENIKNIINKHHTNMKFRYIQI